MTIDLQARQVKPLRNTYAHVAKYIGDDKLPTRYQEATFGAQSSENFHYRPTWEPEFELYDAARSKLVLADWYVLKDPNQYYYGNWTMQRARQQDSMEANYQFVESRELLEKTPADLRDLVGKVLLPFRHVAWGGNMNNMAIGAYGYGTAFTAAASMHSMDQLGVAQYITRFGLVLGGTEILDKAKNAWLNDAPWQELRRYVEDTLVVKDPFELFVAQNFALDGQIYPLIYRQFIDQYVAGQGGAALCMLTAFMPEWHDESARWVDALVKVAAAESPANRDLITEWVKDWGARARAALAPIASMAWDGTGGSKGADEIAAAWQILQNRAEKNGLAL
ncbi:MAG: aromatic/alkene monooxygenase hydroxylase subunit beta [Candidatus Symbiobacter sp.]|nr:aromatic/alkene monooxygenase hydroxylase subunit beta [Candidatus Symbiobacter sp.]